MADAVEALGQHMRQEAADELGRLERHGLVAAGPLDAVVLVCEGDARLVSGDQAPVRDGNPVGVAREIGQHCFRPGERRLSILPIITGLGSKSVTPTIRCTGKKAWSCGRKIQKGNVIFV